MKWSTKNNKVKDIVAAVAIIAIPDQRRWYYQHQNKDTAENKFEIILININVIIIFIYTLLCLKCWNIFRKNSSGSSFKGMFKYVELFYYCRVHWLHAVMPDDMMTSVLAPQKLRHIWTGLCAVPPLPQHGQQGQPGQAGQGNLTRNSVHRRSLNRLFSRNTSDNTGDKHGNKVDHYPTFLLYSQSHHI